MIFQRVHEERDRRILRRGEEGERGDEDEERGEFHGGREVNVFRHAILSTKGEKGERALAAIESCAARTSRYFPSMSFAEVKKTIRTMPRSKRRELLTFLTTLDQTRDPAWLTEIERRKKEMKAGKKISREEAMRLLGITENALAAAR